ncbi:MAG: phosphoribosyltransferase [Actinomycetaceae bacterium]|nr:phosphoribosyltransferase [Actinomycetaceae bacterium]MDY6082938.1 phosphoribosyltransferase [Actinomycetaceae bacterium]
MAEISGVPNTASEATPAAAPSEIVHETLSWPAFGEASRWIAQAIWDSGWMPDLIVAIARGGLLPAGAIAYSLGVKAIGTMNVEFYTGIAETKDEPVLIPPLMDPSSLEGKKVLVVDDVADSGKTLELVLNMIRENGITQLDGGEPIRVAEARSATIYSKPRTVVEPDYVWKSTDAWIDFPWSTLPPVSDPDSTAA